MADDYLLPDPGTMASDGQLPQDYSPTDLSNLTPTYPTTLLPVSVADPYSSFDPLAQSGNAADAASSGGDFNWDNFLGGLAQTGTALGLADTQALLAAPAIAQAQIPAQQQAINNQIALAQAQANINTGSFTTVLIWGAIAWLIVSLIGGAEGR